MYVHIGGGLPTPYLAAGGVAVLAIIGIALAGAKPDQAAPAAPSTSSGSKSGAVSLHQNCFHFALVLGRHLGETISTLRTLTPVQLVRHIIPLAMLFVSVNMSDWKV